MKSPIQYLWQRLFSPQGEVLRRKIVRRRRVWRRYWLDEPLWEAVQRLAAQDQRDEQDVVIELISTGLAQRLEVEQVLQCWDNLTERERQVVELLCTGVSYRQVGEQLGISPETVKSHAHRALTRLGLRSRQELRRLLGMGG